MSANAPAAPAAATPGNFIASVAARAASAPAAPTAPAPHSPAGAVGPQSGGAQPPAGTAQSGNPVAGRGAPDMSPDEQAFNAAIQGQEPANDNAETIEPHDEQTIDPATGLPQAPPDPWQEPVHGVPAQAVIEALKAGELPAELLDHVRVKVNPNGNEMVLPLADVARGYMMSSDYTHGKRQLAEARRDVEGTKGKLRELFANMDKPEGFATAMERMGYTDSARSLVTQGWGTAEQPNVDGFIDGMRRLGHYDTFTAAARKYAADYTARLMQFGGQQNRQAAEQLVSEWENQERAMWRARLDAERAAEQIKRDKWKADRDALLQQRQEAPDPQAQTRVLKHIDTARETEFARYGVPNTDLAKGLFVQEWKQIDARIRRDGRRPVIAEIAREAALATWQRMAASGQLQAGAAPAPANDNGQPAHAQQMPTALPTRPAAAPVTTAPRIPQGGSPDRFAERLAALRAGRR